MTATRDACQVLVPQQRRCRDLRRARAHRHRADRLPRQVANCGVALGVAGLAGAAFLAASVPMPAHSLIRDITFSAGSLAIAPAVLAYPVWLIVLSYRLPGHLLTAPTRRADRAQADPWEVV